MIAFEIAFTFVDGKMENIGNVDDTNYIYIITWFIQLNKLEQLLSSSITIIYFRYNEFHFVQ